MDGVSPRESMVRGKPLPQLWLLGGVGLLFAIVGLTAIASGSGLASLPHPLAVLDERLPGVFRLHMLASGIGLMLVPIVLAVRRRPEFHRPLGRVTAVLFLIGFAAALPSALASEALALARLGFFTQGLLSLAFLLAGYVAIRRGAVPRHRACMLSVAALAGGAIVLRLLLAATVWLRLPFDEAYAVLAWVSWMAPLAAVWLAQFAHPVGRRAHHDEQGDASRRSPAVP